MALVSVSFKLWSFNMAYTLIFFAENIWVVLTCFQQKYCELDIILTRAVNILTTNELVKLTMLWTTRRKRTFWHVQPTKTQISLLILADAQLDQCLRCPYEETLHLWLCKMYTVKILISLCECAGWSQSSVGGHVGRYVFGHCCFNNSVWRLKQ